MSLKVKKTRDVLKIYLPLEKPRSSNSGKTMLVASTYGAKTTEIDYEGARIVVVANAFIYRTKKENKS
jgi:hypothetical protein